MPLSFELREDGSKELEEAGGRELREEGSSVGDRIPRINGWWVGANGSIGYYYDTDTEVLPVKLPNTEFPNS